MFTSITVKV